MDIDADLHYPADPERTMAVLSDQGFQEEKCRQTGALSYTVSVTSDAGAQGRIVIDSVRNLPTESLPDFARSFLGGQLEVHEVQNWGPAGADGARDCVLTVDISGAPMKLTGTMALRPDGGDASTVAIRSVLKASIPLIGGKAEKAAAGPIRAAMAKEEQLGAEWLAR